jgi:hypothetical protein
MAGLCEHDNESQGSLKARNSFLDQPSDYLLFIEDHVPWK